MQKMSSFFNNDEQFEGLILAVQRFSCLWDLNTQSYHNHESRTIAWTQVAAQCGCPDVSECCKKWKALRDKYRRIKKMSSPTGNGNGKKWSLFSIMSFLDPVMVHRKKTLNVNFGASEQLQVKPLLPESESECSKIQKHNVEDLRIESVFNSPFNNSERTKAICQGVSIAHADNAVCSIQPSMMNQNVNSGFSSTDLTTVSKPKVKYRKRKGSEGSRTPERKDIQEKREKDNDSTGSFFNFIADEARTMPKRLRMKFQKEVMELVIQYSIEAESIQCD